MGRARNLLTSATLTATSRNRSEEEGDRFVAIMGPGRGRASARALLAGLDDADAQRELARLGAAVRDGSPAETLDVLSRAWDGSAVGPLAALADILVVETVKGLFADPDIQTRTIKLLSFLNFRTRYSEHVVGEPTGPDLCLHLCAVPNRQRRVGDSVQLMCGRVLDAGSYGSAGRGDWKEESAWHCRGCAEHAPQYEETAETSDYPALSRAQASEVSANAQRLLRQLLPRELGVHHDDVYELAASGEHCYSLALQKLIAHEFYEAGEWSFYDALLSDRIYTELLAEASEHGRTELAGLLTEDDWSAILDGEMLSSFPLSGAPLAAGFKRLGERIAERIRHRLEE